MSTPPEGGGSDAVQEEPRTEVSWQVQDWDPALPGSGRLVISDGSGATVWADLTPDFTAGLRQALDVVAASHDVQQQATPQSRTSSTAPAHPGAGGAEPDGTVDSTRLVDELAPERTRQPTRPSARGLALLALAGVVGLCLVWQVIAGALRISF